MNRYALLVAAAIACAGCNAIDWDFGSTDAAPTLVGADASTADPADGPTLAMEDAPGRGPFGDANANTFDPCDAGPLWALCVDGGCPTMDLHCNTSSGQCVPCLGKGDCPGTSLPTCDLNPGDTFENLCVECVHDTDCSQGEICLANQCVPTCSNNHSSCKPSAPICGPQELCFSCTTPGPGDCSHNETCFVPTGRCVDCASDLDCTSSLAPRCDRRKNVCVRCLNSMDCNGGVCDPQSGTCTSGKM